MIGINREGLAAGLGFAKSEKLVDLGSSVRTVHPGAGYLPLELSCFWCCFEGLTGAQNGFSDIRVNFQIDADASEDDIKALVAQSQKRSAVFDLLTNPTNVHVTVG